VIDHYLRRITMELASQLFNVVRDTTQQFIYQISG